MVLLIGNYPADRQQSMQRFASMIFEGLTAAGIPAQLIQPEARLGKLDSGRPFIAKWLAYIDKFLLFPRRLTRALRGASIVHICDHSNAMYANRISDIPVVVTCHDLLAVRGALGEQTDCPASTTGTVLQRWILCGLRNAAAIACVSRATLEDAKRLLPKGSDRPIKEVVTLALSYPYRPLPPDEAARRLRDLKQLPANVRFVLHVGSNLRRKNREGVLRIFAQTRAKWDGMLVFAGDPLTPALRNQSRDLGIDGRVIEAHAPSNELLEALYNRATALLYPSRFEGFGWPIIEAQAAGCPVIASDSGPMPEVTNGTALLRQVDDEEGFADDLLSLLDSNKHEAWRERGLRNAERFGRKEMIARYVDLYRSVGAQL